MNAGGSLSKFAPYTSDATDESPWRVVTNLEGLSHVATSFLSTNPEVISHLRVRVNLGMSDASTSRLNRIKRFFKSLQVYDEIQVLDLGHCQISDHTCRLHMSKMLERNSSIIELKLNNNAFTNGGAMVCFQSLVNSSVSKLNMANNTITRDLIDEVIDIIGSDKFSELDFSHTDIGAQGVKLLAGVLPKLQQLNTFSLNNVRAGDEGAVELAKAFDAGGNTSITTLNLAENHIGREGVTSLISKFVPGKNENVTSLKLSKNYFGNQGFAAIHEVMRVNVTMKSLSCDKVGLTATAFNAFCEMMTTRYSQPFGPYPDLLKIGVSGNGLGNPSDELFAMLKCKNCTINKLGYNANDVDNYGCKLFRHFFCGVEYKSHTSMYKDRKVEEKEEAGDTPEIIQKKKEITERRNEFESLSIGNNLITSDGAEQLRYLIGSYSHLKELDVCDNKLGLGGAIHFKKALRSLQCNEKNFTEDERKFTLYVMPNDVTLVGVNHLAIGIREHVNTIKKHVMKRSSTHCPDGFHVYERSAQLQKLWDQSIGSNYDILEVEDEDFKKTYSSENGLKKRKISQLFSGLKNRKIYRDSETFHLGIFQSPMSEFNTKSNSVLISGVNDEGEDLWSDLMSATFEANYIGCTERGVYIWNDSVFSFIKEGCGAIIANQLYRFGTLLRMKYYSESTEYIRDLYLYRYAKGGLEKAMRSIEKNKVPNEALIARMVVDDIKDFWEVIMHQTCEESEGLTMFEFVLKYGKAPLIDVVRQFINVFPATAYAHPKSPKPAVFLLQKIAHSGKTYRDLCLASEDKFVKRYAQAKRLILFRFLEIEPVYVSKFVRISKVEDLLLTEEYNDEERFFYMRRIANSSAQKDENLSSNEFDAHQSFMDSSGNYLPDKPVSDLKNGNIEYANPMDKVSNLILKNENKGLDVGFIGQISQLYHKKQLLRDDSLMPSFTKIYKTNLREVLDNESLAGGRDLKRAQIMLKMLASALNHFNDREWVKRTHSDRKYSMNSLATKPRCHGNVKPRNIVLRCVSELPNLDLGDDFMPGKWVLSDFTRSTEHGKDYFPAAHSGYNPPEVAKRLMSSSEHHLKKRVTASDKIDVWQFGCVLFEVLSGTTLFKMEGNNDLIIDEEERAELVNWLSLDEERSDLILNQLRSRKTYNNVNHSLSLTDFSNFSDKEIEAIINSGKQLVQWCLQGDPNLRPTFTEILSHGFFARVDIGRKSVEKDADMIANILRNNSYQSWDNESFLLNQPHMHLINTEFEEAGTVVKSIEKTLSEAGCRLTTDSIKNVSPTEYNKQIRDNVQNARVIVCLLTNDCFFKPNVVKQLIFAEDYRIKDEKNKARLLFLNLSGQVDLSQSGLTWDKAKFSKEWRQSNEFHFLVKSLATEKIELKNFSIDTVNLDDPADAWAEFLQTHFRPMVLSYIKDQIQYEKTPYLQQPMVDRMLLDGKLVPTLKVSKFSINAPSSSNYKDASNLLNKKLEDRKDKFMNLYFLPSNKVKQGAVRSYVLCADGQPDETYNAVSAIARALEEPTSINLVDEASRHKESSDPRNKLINKVKTSYNLKKDSHLKVGGRSRAIQTVKDSVLNVTRKEGALLVVLYATAGVYERYGAFLKEAIEKRGSDLAVVLVSSPGFKVQDHHAEIEKHIPSDLQNFMKTPAAYHAYNKNGSKTWQYDSFMETVQQVAIKCLTTPLPKETFTS